MVEMHMIVCEFVPKLFNVSDSGLWNNNIFDRFRVDIILYRFRHIVFPFPTTY